MKRVIVSGFFNPLHGGHLDMIESARAMGDYLIVVVNNDVQAVLKKGKVILDERNRTRLLTALRDVDEVILAVDSDPYVIETLELIAKKYTEDELIFANGGDRDTSAVVPETRICNKYGISMRFDAGEGKPDSSSRINKELGHEE